MSAIPRPSRQHRNPFLSDVKTLRKRAREHMEEGAVTPGYGADAEQVCKVLNQALATEIVCVLRYKRHYFMAQGIASESVKAEFLAHANEEQAHADEIAGRIVQLGGEPDLDPDGLTRPQPFRICGRQIAARHDQGRPGGGTRGHRELPGNHRLGARQGLDHTEDARGNSRRRGGARRGHGVAARRPQGLIARIAYAHGRRIRH